MSFQEIFGGKVRLLVYTLSHDLRLSLYEGTIFLNFCISIILSFIQKKISV